jgi:hypothetical protein
MLKYSNPSLAWIVEHWTITIFLPAILLMVAVLALVTRWSDGRDESARQREQ